MHVPMNRIARIASLVCIFCATVAPSKPLPVSPKEDCLDFSKATEYKSIGPFKIRVQLDDLSNFDIDLGGPQCSGVDAKDVTIRRAPIRYLCPGPQTGRDQIVFKDPVVAKDIECSITQIAHVVVPKTVPTPH